jgi:translation initiation factor IF-3
LSRPFNPRFSRRQPPKLRVNGRIRAREVRVIGVDGEQVGVKSLGEAISLARAAGVDLVEVAPSATPPVCRLVEYGRYEYEKAKREKERKKHQNRVKEVQLSARIDQHDFRIKVDHAIDFLCEDMKVKASLRFRGREMAHQEYGFQVVQKFIRELAPYGQPDFKPKLVGRNVNVMFSPLPRNKRAKNPRTDGAPADSDHPPTEPQDHPTSGPVVTVAYPTPPEPPPPRPEGFNNNPFNEL